MRAIIPAAGEGSRLRPITKTVPKELLPVGGKALVQWALEEALEVGITEIAVVISPRKDMLRTYLTPSPLYLDEELESMLDKVSLSFIVQEELRGLGHAILAGASVVGEGPFALILPDNLVFAHEPAMRTLMRAFQDSGEKTTVWALQRVDPGDTHHSYLSPIEVAGLQGNRCRVKRIWDKGSEASSAPNIRGIGRAICTPAFLHALEEREDLEGDEQEIGAMNAVVASEGLDGIILEGTAIDVGTWEQYLRALAHAEGWPSMETRDVT